MDHISGWSTLAVDTVKSCKKIAFHDCDWMGLEPGLSGAPTGSQWYCMKVLLRGLLKGLKNHKLVCEKQTLRWSVVMQLQLCSPSPFCRGASWGPIHAWLTPLSIIGFYQSTKWQSCECPTAVHYVKKWPSLPLVESEKKHRSRWPLNLANFPELMNSSQSSSIFSRGALHSFPGLFVDALYSLKT